MQWLGALYVVGALCVVGLAGFAVWRDRADTRAQARDEVTSATVLIEEQMIALVGATDQMLLRLIDQIRGRNFRELWSSREDWLALRALVEPLPYAVGLIVVDAEGRTVLGRNAFPTARTDLTTRDYVQAHAAGEEFHIGRTIVATVAGKLVFTISRRLTRADGSFAGLVAATIDGEYLSRAYGRMSLGDSGALSLVRSDGLLIARHPLTPQFRDLVLSDRSLFASLPPSAAGVRISRSPVDGVVRLTVHRAFETLPLVAVASLSLAEIDAAWQRRAAWVAGVAAAFLAVAAMLFRQVRRGIARETGLRAEMERSNRELATALAAKNLLLREVHHRVKNNLQVVSSLMNMQLRRTADPGARDSLERTMQRINAMTLLHRLLYQTDELTTIDVGAFLREIAAEMRIAFDLDGRGIVLRTDTVPCVIELDRAVPVGLALAEALTNAIKHAFPDGRTGRIEASVRREGNTVTLEVRDDGVGLAAEGGDPGIGRTLLLSLARQAGGDSRFVADGQGTGFVLVLPLRRDGSPASDGAVRTGYAGR